MTRSVEIPEAALKAAVDALYEIHYPDDPTMRQSQWSAAARVLVADRQARLLPEARASIEAALPYLASAKICSCRTVAPSGWDRVVDATDPGCVIHGQPAPAGDGGLREALGQAWDDGNATGLDGYVGPGRGAGEVDPEAERARERMIDKLATQPAVPMSDEAIERAYAMWVSQMKEHGLPRTALVAAFQAAHPAAPAVPQPVDREALIRVIEDTTREHLWDKVPGSDEDAFEFEPVAPKVADAVLAVLAGGERP